MTHYQKAAAVIVAGSVLWLSGCSPESSRESSGVFACKAGKNQCVGGTYGDEVAFVVVGDFERGEIGVRSGPDSSEYAFAAAWPDGRTFKIMVEQKNADDMLELRIGGKQVAIEYGDVVQIEDDKAGVSFQRYRVSGLKPGNVSTLLADEASWRAVER
jgi:hypothetical protein